MKPLILGADQSSASALVELLRLPQLATLTQLRIAVDQLVDVIQDDWRALCAQLNYCLELTALSFCVGRFCARAPAPDVPLTLGAPPEIALAVSSAWLEYTKTLQTSLDPAGFGPMTVDLPQLRVLSIRPQRVLLRTADDLGETLADSACELPKLRALNLQTRSSALPLLARFAATRS